jgi:hypothetical protein
MDIDHSDIPIPRIFIHLVVVVVEISTRFDCWGLFDVC